MSVELKVIYESPLHARHCLGHGLLKVMAISGCTVALDVSWKCMPSLRSGERMEMDGINGLQLREEECTPSLP
eukprot:806045-Pelagomonas_calceolata.AAC.7